MTHPPADPMPPEPAEGAAPPRPVGPASDGVVTAHAPCWQCGYDLHGVSLEGACPECGEKVRFDAEGKPRGSINRAWAARVAAGARSVQIAALASLAMLALALVMAAADGSIRGAAGAGAALGGVTWFLCFIICGVGVWNLTAESPDFEGGRFTRLRRLLRWVTGAMFITAFAAAALLIGMVSRTSMGSRASEIVASTLVLAAVLLGPVTAVVLGQFLAVLVDRADVPGGSLAALAANRALYVFLALAVLVVVDGLIAAGLRSKPAGLLLCAGVPLTGLTGLIAAVQLARALATISRWLTPIGEDSAANPLSEPNTAGPSDCSGDKHESTGDSGKM